MKKIKIKSFPYKSTSEIGQLIGYKYAFLSKDLEQCHTLIKCRDFLQDAVRNQLFNRLDGIYGFQYDPSKCPLIDTDEMKMLVVQWGSMDYETFHTEMELACKILNLFEKDAGMKTMSKVCEVKSYGKPAVVFFSHKDWINSPFLISLHTFLVRLAARGYSFNDLEELKKCIKNDKYMGCDDNDHGYLQSIGVYLPKILPARKHLMFDKDGADSRFDHGDIHEFHNHTGIVSLCAKSTYDENLKKVIQEHILS